MKSQDINACSRTYAVLSSWRFKGPLALNPRTSLSGQLVSGKSMLDDFVEF